MSTATERLKEAKEHFEDSCGELVTSGDKDSEQYNLCMGLWCLADALLQMQNDIETIKDDVRQIKYK